MTIRSSRQAPPSITKEQALRLPPAGRLAYYDQIRVKHARVHHALADLKLLSMPGAGSDITLLVGPTGVGKSTVVQGLREDVLKENKDRMQQDPAIIPIVITEAPASGERGFSWRIFYQRLGEELQEPLMLKKQETAVKDGRVTVRPVSNMATVASLRTAVEKAIVRRSTAIVVVDEAAHLLRNIQGNSLENHMDAIKSLANICGMNIILVGSYDLVPLLNLSAQVARRTSIVHFPRYLTGEELDERAFAKSVRWLGSYLPLEEDVDLSGYAQDLQAACVGCVGILKDTLSRALAISLNDGGKWRESHLERALLSPKALESILAETLMGEQEMLTKALGSGSFKAMAEKYRDMELTAMGAS